MPIPINDEITKKAKKVWEEALEDVPELIQLPVEEIIRGLERSILAEYALEPQEGGGEKSIFDPPSFKDYVGQSAAKDMCQMIISAAKIDKRPLPNIIFDGDAGLGKTTIAKLVFQKMNVPYRMTDGASATKIKLTEFKDYMIIDEIHNLDAQVCDSLNVLLDRGTLHIIGATTQLGNLPKPFRSRFRHIRLTRYTNEEIAEILHKTALRKHLRIRKQELFEIARRSRNTPRVGLMYLANVFEFATVKKEKTISSKTVEKVFEMLGVDERGLTKRDFEYLEAIPDDRSVGLQYISARMGVDSKTLEEEVEPYLMQLGLVDRTSRGRKKILSENELIDKLEAMLKAGGTI